MTTLQAANERGFTLVELLVVMIVLGLLAAIAVPTFLNQRARAHDAATKADVSTVAKEIATYFVDGTGTLSLDDTTVPGAMVITDGAWSTQVELTKGVSLPSLNGSAGLDQPTGWCVALVNTAGAVREFRYSAQAGLGEGTC